MKQLRTAKAVVAVSAVLVLLGSSMAFAADQNQKATFHSGHEFQVYDPAEPVVDTNVNGAFIEHNLVIHVNMSAHDGVKQLKGTYSIVVEIWNDTQSAYVPYSTLVSGKTITLTPTPITTDFTFKTSAPGSYNVHVAFTTTSVELA